MIIFYYKDNGLFNNELVIGHELIHSFQYGQSFALNAYLDRPLKNLEKNNLWFKKYQGIFYTEFNLLLNTVVIYGLEKDHDKKLFEKEAYFYTE